MRRVGHARSVYKKHHGNIPIDETGRTYEIHHIDGDHSNDSIDNLRAVTIQEHYNLHLAQNDYAACLVMAKRMKVSSQEKSELSSLAALKRVQEGTHHWTSETHAKKCSDMATKKNNELATKGSHPWQSGNRSESIAAHVKGPGHNKMLLATGQHSSQKLFVCPHCHKEVKGTTNAKRWHFDKCREKK